MKSASEGGGSKNPDAKNDADLEGLRKRAESALGKGLVPGRKWVEQDLVRLVHELEVHQAELEVQGEELRLKNVELEELFHSYAALYHGAPVGFLNLNANWVIDQANDAASELLGLAKNTLKHMPFSHFVLPEDRAKYYKLLKGLNRLRSIKSQAEFRLARYSGSVFFAHIEVVPFRDARGGLEGWLIAFIDISRQKAAEESLQEAVDRLRAMSARLLSIQEEERKRIARDLHDSFGQTLAAVKYGIENILVNKGSEFSGDTVRLFEMLIPTIQMAIEEVRNLCTGLRPAILDDMGILATMEWLCRMATAAFPNLRVEFVMNISEKDVPEELKIILFRIAQEALTNVEKHGEAERVDISLVKSHGEIELVIEDNGKGFDFEAVSRNADSAGMGLRSMAERAELSGGTLVVTSRKGRGTRVEARWTIPAAQAW